jgi:hypothetical protein
MTRLSERAAREPFTRRMIVRAVVKALCLFAVFNLIYGAIQPVHKGLLPTLYNILFPGRPRFGKGYEYDAYRLVSDHIISRAQSETFNIAFIGSSEVWGLRAVPSGTISAYLTNLGMVAADGRPVRVYNLGFPVPNGIKDLNVLEAVMRQQIPIDLVILSTFEKTLEVQPHEISSANPYLETETLNHYHLMPVASQIIPSVPNETPISEWNDRDALSMWLLMQMRGLTWSLTGDDVDMSMLGYRQRVPSLTEFVPPLEHIVLQPQILAAFAQFSRERGIPVLILAAPVPVDTYSFSSWLQAQSQTLGLPLLDCWELFDQPEAFENFYHIMVDEDVPYASVLAKHLSDEALSQVPGLPLHLPADFVRPSDSCAVYLSSGSAP